MNDNQRLVTWLRKITLTCWVLAIPGCSEVLGPERMNVTRIKGFVREGTQPVSAGWIEFFPVEGTVGNLCSARLLADGSFEAKHVAVGINLVRLANARISSFGAKQLFGAYTSPIRRTITVATAEPVVVDVVDEALRFRKTRAESARPESRGPGEAR